MTLASLELTPGPDDWQVTCLNPHDEQVGCRLRIAEDRLEQLLEVLGYSVSRWGEPGEITIAFVIGPDWLDLELAWCEAGKERTIDTFIATFAAQVRSQAGPDRLTQAD